MKGEKNCYTCSNVGNAEEMVGNRIRILCNATERMVFVKYGNECEYCWEEK